MIRASIGGRRMQRSLLWSSRIPVLAGSSALELVRPRKPKRSTVAAAAPKGTHGLRTSAKGQRPKSLPEAPLSSAAPLPTSDNFPWTSHWYPVAVLEDLEPHRPHAVHLLGIPVAFWRDSAAMPAGRRAGSPAPSNVPRHMSHQRLPAARQRGIVQPCGARSLFPTRSPVSRARSVVARALPSGGASGSMSAPAGTSGAAGEVHHDVAIIGGGPAGLLAAKAMLAVMPGADVKVFEAAPGYQRNLGAGVMVEVNGWRALHAVDKELAEKLAACSILVHTSRIFNEKGGPLAFQMPRNDHQAGIQAHGHTARMIQWGGIRQALFEALPPGIVSFSSRIVGLTPGQPGGEPAVLQVQVPREEAQRQPHNGNGGGGNVGSEGGSTRLVTADLVIAADGYYSRTKRIAFGASGPPLLPTFRGRVVWRALVAYPDPDQMPGVLREAGSEAVALWWLAEGQPPERTALVYPVNDNRFVWTCIAPVADIEAAGLPPWSPHCSAEQDLGIQQTGSVGSDPKQRCMAVFRNHPPEVLDLLERTDPRVITEHGYYTHDIAAIRGAPDWVRGNVVVVGDAAHTGPPDGMGLNMAWEDVAVLAAEVKRAGGRLDSGEVLAAYCAARLPRVRDIWSEADLVKPRRQAAKLAAAFEPLGAGSSSRDRTAPLLPVQYGAAGDVR